MVGVEVDNDGRPVRVLVVDDEPHIADLVATVARYEGWQARTAHIVRPTDPYRFIAPSLSLGEFAIS